MDWEEIRNLVSEKEHGCFLSQGIIFNQNNKCKHMYFFFNLMIKFYLQYFSKYGKGLANFSLHGDPLSMCGGGCQQYVIQDCVGPDTLTLM